jgi:hypothetical protein
MAGRSGRGPVSAQSDGGLAAGLRLGSAVPAPPGWNGAFVPVSRGGASGPTGGGGRIPESAGLGRDPGRAGARGCGPVPLGACGCGPVPLGGCGRGPVPPDGSSRGPAGPDGCAPWPSLAGGRRTEGSAGRVGVPVLPSSVGAPAADGRPAPRVRALRGGAPSAEVGEVEPVPARPGVGFSCPIWSAVPSSASTASAVPVPAGRDGMLLCCSAKPPGPA